MSGLIRVDRFNPTHLDHDRVHREAPVEFPDEVQDVPMKQQPDYRLIQSEQSPPEWVGILPLACPFAVQLGFS